MRILVLGGDGYLGWPTSMYLSNKGHDVFSLDNGIKRKWERSLKTSPLLEIPRFRDRGKAWNALSKRKIKIIEADICDYASLRKVLKQCRPEAVVHYGEQPSAPYSMITQKTCVETQYNNVIGTLNLIWAIRDLVPDCHIVKLGTMGEYGTPNIDIEEGYIEILHNGRSDVLPFPKQPGSFYHLSKVHDSHNLLFACRVWKLRATDLNQGVVYGIETDETRLSSDLVTSFHYDEVFGTALNRFCVQAICGIPLTVYGKGGQKRGFLNIRDTVQCVELALLNPAPQGEFRVFNQFTETFSVTELAELVQKQGNAIGLNVTIESLPNPRVEKEEHYYNPKHVKLSELGLKPRLLSDELIDSMLHLIQKSKSRIKKNTILPKVAWRSESKSK